MATTYFTYRVCPGCGQTMYWTRLSRDEMYAECGGKDNGICCEAVFTFDSNELGEDIARTEWVELNGDDELIPSKATRAAIEDAFCLGTKEYTEAELTDLGVEWMEY